MIDPDAAMPVWMQLRDVLKTEIESGTRAGRLPGEKHLAAQFGVAPGTVRKALKALRDAGLIETYAGRGSEIVPPEKRPGGR